jgi:hypothetical protein
MFNKQIEEHKKALEKALGLQTENVEIPFEPSLPPDGRFYQKYLEGERRKLSKNPILQAAKPPTYSEMSNQLSVDQYVNNFNKIVYPKPYVPLPPEIPRRKVFDLTELNFGEAEKMWQSVVDRHRDIFGTSRNNSQTEVTEEEIPAEAEADTGAIAAVTSMFGSLMKSAETAMNAAWFASQQKMTMPTDPAIKKHVANIYGGERSKVRFTVKAVKATDVPAMDWLSSTSDPYLEIVLVRGVQGLSAGQLDSLPGLAPRKKSSIVFNTLNPVWNEPIELDSVEIIPVLADALLHISIWDHDAIMRNDAIGYCTMPLIDTLESSGICPFPLCPIQGSEPVSLHVGAFVKFELKSEGEVGLLKTSLVALQGFEKYKGSSDFRISVKLVEDDPLASSEYVVNSVSDEEVTNPFPILETGHANLTELPPLTQLFKFKRTKPLFIHLTVLGVGALQTRTRYAQLAMPVSMLEQIRGYRGHKLKLLKGNDDKQGIKKCKVYFAVSAELASE